MQRSLIQGQVLPRVLHPRTGVEIETKGHLVQRDSFDRSCHPQNHYGVGCGCQAGTAAQPSLLLNPATYSFPVTGNSQAPLINSFVSLLESLSEEPNSDIHYFLRQGQNKTSPIQCQMDYIWH